MTSMGLQVLSLDVDGCEQQQQQQPDDGKRSSWSSVRGAISKGKPQRPAALSTMSHQQCHSNSHAPSTLPPLIRHPPPPPSPPSPPPIAGAASTRYLFAFPSQVCAPLYRAILNRNSVLNITQAARDEWLRRLT